MFLYENNNIMTGRDQNNNFHNEYEHDRFLQLYNDTTVSPHVYIQVYLI